MFGLDKFWLLISGITTAIVAVLLRKNSKLSTENNNLKYENETILENEKEIANQVKKTSEIVKLQSEVSANTATSVNAIHDWMSNGGKTDNTASNVVQIKKS